MPVRFSSAGALSPGHPAPGHRAKSPKVSFYCNQDSAKPELSPTQQYRGLNPPSTQVPDAVTKKEESLIDALQASQAANEALEAVIKLQARAIEQMMEENKKLCQQAKIAHLPTQPKPVMCEASTEILADELCMIQTLDISVQTTEAGKQATTAQTAPDAPQSSPRIQPPVVPPTPRRMSKSHEPKGIPRVEAPSELSKEKMSQANASENVAEAFRLGWLAGVKSNSMAASKSPCSTRSDDSQPSDPGSFVVGSNKSDSGDSRGSDSRVVTPVSVTPGSESPPLCNKLPALPTMMPPPPPPALLAPPSGIPFEQLG